MAKAIEVTWKKGIYAGYIDIFPVDEFAAEVSGVERVHLIRGPKGGNYTARYNLDVQDFTARFDYNAFANFNERHGIELGIMEFHFTSAARNTVAGLRWNGQLVPASEATVATVGNTVSIAEAVTSQQQAFARRRLRPGQSQFRHTLDVAYGARCCVSGCGVPWAIDVAHIEPYKDKQSNGVTNGLLLRSDLHALFDAGQLAVHPESRIVYFAEEARAWTEYDNLHGVQKLRGPQPGYETCAPEASDFSARWTAFLRDHGDPESG